MLRFRPAIGSMLGFKEEGQAFQAEGNVTKDVSSKFRKFL